MNTAVFWDVAPYSPVDPASRFRGACCLNHRPDDEGNKQKMKGAFLHEK
jgi:hypothetical protein